MSIEGNMHGYIIKTIEILRSTRELLDKEADFEIKTLDSWEGQLDKRLRNCQRLLEAIEKLDEKEISILKELAIQEHEEGEELHEILSTNY